MPRPGAAGSVLRTRLPDDVTRCQALVSRYVIDRPSGLNAYCPESQWTAGAIVEGGGPAVGRAVVGAAVVADVVGVVLAVGVEPPHPATASIATRAAAPARTA